MQLQKTYLVPITLLLLSSLVFAVPAEITSISLSTSIALNLDWYGFGADYVRSIGGAPITDVEGGACNFTMYYSNASAAGVFPSVYDNVSDFYSNYSNTLVQLGSPDNYTLVANCSAPGFDNATRSFSPIEVTRAGIRFYILDSYGGRYTRYDNASIGVGYFDSIDSYMDESGLEVFDLLSPADGAACSVDILNTTSPFEVIAKKNLTFNSSSGLFELTTSIGSTGLNLTNDLYTWSVSCNSTDPTFETRSVRPTFEIIPLTCGYVTYSDLTLEEDVACTGADAEVNAGMPVVYLAADNVTLNCAGHSITGPANNSLAITGVFSDGFSGLTVNNCAFTNLYVGALFGLGSVNLTNLTVNSSGALGIGSFKSNLTISNVVLSNNNASLIFESSNTTLQNVSLINSTVHGVALYNSTGLFSTLEIRNSKIGLEIADSQGTSFSGLTFSGNELDLFLTRGTELVVDLAGHVFTGVTTLGSFATWDYTVNSSVINNVNSSTAIASFDSLTISVNSSSIAYGALAVTNGSGVNWTRGLIVNSTYVSVNSTLALALDKSATITLTGASYANTTVFEVRSGGLNCTACVRLAASPVKFSVPGFTPLSNYSTVAVEAPPGNETEDPAPAPTPTPAPAPSPSAAPVVSAAPSPAAASNNSASPSTSQSPLTASTVNSSNFSNSTLLANSSVNSTVNETSLTSLTGLFAAGQNTITRMSSFATRFSTEQPIATAGFAGFILILFGATTALKLKMMKEKQFKQGKPKKKV